MGANGDHPGRWVGLEFMPSATQQQRTGEVADIMGPLEPEVVA